jgi:hypothetical protein
LAPLLTDCEFEAVDRIVQLTFRREFGDIAMMTSRNNAIAEKRDLHVGGLGSNAPAGIATLFEPLIDPALDASEPLLERVRDVVQSADDYVHDNPWAAIGVVALVGLAAGYLLSRRS